MALTERLENSDADLHALRIERSIAGRRPRRGPKRWLIIVAVIMIVLVGILIAATQLKLGFAAKEVRVATVSRKGPGGPQPILTASGYVIARHQVEVGSKVTGRVVSLEVREGDMIAKGQVIARLDSWELEAQLRQASANLAAATARLAEAEAGSRPQEIDRARAEMARTEADLKNAEVNLRRVEQLVKEGVLEQKALDDARARFDMSQAERRAVRESYELARIGPRKEAIDLARAQVRQADAEVAMARAQFDNTIIRAPVGGTILDRYVDMGEMVTTGFTSDRGAKQAIIAIADLKDLQVELDVTEADIARVRLDQPTTIVPDAYSDRQYQGMVEYIASVADRQKATIKVKVRVLDPDEYLRPDMGAKVTFYEKGTEIPRERIVVMAPKSAIVQQGNNAVVFLARDSKVAVQQVTLGKEESGYVEVLGGLQGGESVIIGGQESLKERDAITVQR